jgi:hypothetical protein
VYLYINVVNLASTRKERFVLKDEDKFGARRFYKSTLSLHLEVCRVKDVCKSICCASLVQDVRVAWGVCRVRALSQFSFIIPTY